MAASLVLIHSPSVGPRTWQPVAHRLTEPGVRSPGRSLGFCRRSAGTVGTQPDGPGSPRMTSPSAPLLMRADATQGTVPDGPG
jgi:hypothetical protein